MKIHEPRVRIPSTTFLKWLIANKLSLNVAKTEFILIGSKSMIKNISNSHPNVFIENKQIKQVYECKTLGVKIDLHLSWKGNTDEICKKVTAGISAMRRIRPFVAQDTLILIYNAIVLPYFDYCSEVWDVFGAAQSKRLQKLQNRAARIILNVSNDVEHNITLLCMLWAGSHFKWKGKKPKQKLCTSC